MTDENFDPIRNAIRVRAERDVDEWDRKLLQMVQKESASEWFMLGIPTEGLQTDLRSTREQRIRSRENKIAHNIVGKLTDSKDMVEHIDRMCRELSEQGWAAKVAP